MLYTKGIDPSVKTFRSLTDGIDQRWKKFDFWFYRSIGLRFFFLMMTIDLIDVFCPQSIIGINPIDVFLTIGAQLCWFPTGCAQYGPTFLWLITKWPPSEHLLHHTEFLWTDRTFCVAVSFIDMSESSFSGGSNDNNFSSLGLSWAEQSSFQVEKMIRAVSAGFWRRMLLANCLTISHCILKPVWTERTSD